jgi:hypothetical protein
MNPLPLMPYNTFIPGGSVEIGQSNYQPYLLFPDSGSPTAWWGFFRIRNYRGGAVYCDLVFSMDTANTTEVVKWDLYVHAVTPDNNEDAPVAPGWSDMDSVEVTVDNDVDDTVSATIALSNNTFANGDMVFLMLQRDNTPSGDNAEGDAQLFVGDIYEAA